MALVTCSAGKTWHATERDLHLPKSSDLNTINHANWRQHAISKIQIGDDDSLHYTAVHALSKRDIVRIKETILAAIKDSREIVKPSPEEELVCVICDVFKV